MQQLHKLYAILHVRETRHHKFIQYINGLLYYIHTIINFLPSNTLGQAYQQAAKIEENWKFL